MTDAEAIKLAIARLVPKVEMLKGHPRLTFTDFGTRRRFSRAVHKAVLEYLKKNCPNLIGTSNVWLARELGLRAIGTVAHEWFMAHLALVDRIELAQKRALHVWQQEYGENLGTALTDTFTTAAFWRDFDVVLSRGFGGVRHDSADPFKFGWDAIEHYKTMGIDPRTKSIIFSDSLDFPKMIELFETFVGLIGVGFGIGTNLTNDLGFEALSIVIKLFMRPKKKLWQIQRMNLTEQLQNNFKK
jgi:nicotinate phosphoribosyltransferase